MEEKNLTLEQWLWETEKELSRLNFEADIYENELEELYNEGYDPYEAAEKYYDDWNHE